MGMDYIGVFQMEGPLVFRVTRLAPLATVVALLGLRLGWLDDIGGRRLGTVGGILLCPSYPVLQGTQLLLYPLHLLLQFRDLFIACSATRAGNIGD